VFYWQRKKINEEKLGLFSKNISAGQYQITRPHTPGIPWF